MTGACRGLSLHTFASLTCIQSSAAMASTYSASFSMRTPFLLTFPDRTLSEVSSVRMDPLATLVSASADPVVEIQNQKFNPAPGATLTGQLANQSGQIVNTA